MLLCNYHAVYLQITLFLTTFKCTYVLYFEVCIEAAFNKITFRYFALFGKLADKIIFIRCTII